MIKPEDITNFSTSGFFTIFRGGCAMILDPRRKTLWILFLVTLFCCYVISDITYTQTATNPESSDASAAGQQTPATEPETESGETVGGVHRTEIYYDSEGLSDPFVTLLVGTDKDEEPGQKPPGIKGMTIGELALFGLGKWENQEVAFVTGSDGKAYTLKVGDLVFDGRVKAI